MAFEKIEYSKTVLNEILESVPSFKSVVNNLKQEYAFCFDYHTGAVAIAIEFGGKMKWLMDPK